MSSGQPVLVVVAILAAGCDGAQPECGSDVDCKGDRICVAGACTTAGEGEGEGAAGEGEGEGQGGEGEGEGAACSSVGGFFDPIGNGAFFTDESNPHMIVDSGNAAGCAGESPFFVVATVTGNYSWSGPFASPTRSQVSVAFASLTPQGCDADPIATRVDGSNCVPPDACLVFCPICFGSVPADMALQIADDFGKSNAVCVDTSTAH
jgi:hypothetical protein